jgi:hypothetical protein
MQVIAEACDGATEWFPRHPVVPLPASDEVLSSDDSDENRPLSEVAGRGSQVLEDSESDEDRPLSEVASQLRRH